MNIPSSNRCFNTPLIAALVLSAGFALGQSGPPVGAKIPDFTVVSGEGDSLNREALEGKVTVMLYLSRSAIGKNRVFTDELLEFYHCRPENIQRCVKSVAVINAGEAKWPITEIWKKKLVESSKERGVPVYGDWSGEMLRDFGFVNDESNVLIVGPDLNTRYFFAGKIEGEEIERVKSLLAKMISEI